MVVNVKNNLYFLLPKAIKLYLVAVFIVTFEIFDNPRFVMDVG